MNVSDPPVPFRDLLNDASISPALADRIISSCSVRDLPTGTRLQHVADDAGGMWGLAEGALSVEIAPGTRDPQMSYLLLPPVWFAEGSIINDAPRMVGFSTIRRSSLLHLPAQRFFSILREEPILWRWLAKVQNLNFQRAMGMVDALMVRTSEARIAAVLRQLGGRLGQNASAPRILDITQSELADIANVSRSVLSPVLKKLASKGFIELGHSTITIADPAALSSFS
jgi:CRP/FNR family transcriptional regulator, cyclic AMP receptor protein